MIVFFLTFRVLCSDTHCTLILLSPKYSMATYFDSGRQSKKDYTNIKKVLDDALPGYATSGGTFTGQFVRTASTPSHTIRISAASSSRLAVRRMPTTPSITCRRSYGTIITLCYEIISTHGPLVGNPGRGPQIRILSHPVGVCGNHPSRCPSYLGAVLPQISTVQQ